MKKLVIIAATAAALFFGQAAMANGVSFTIGHGGAVKWNVHWNGGHVGRGDHHRGGRDRRGNNGHHGRRGNAHHPRPRPRKQAVHCHKQRGHHGHWYKSCHSHGGHHNYRGGH